jgi:putative ABC transport system permease protein
VSLGCDLIKSPKRPFVSLDKSILATRRRCCVYCPAFALPVWLPLSIRLQANAGLGSPLICALVRLTIVGVVGDVHQIGLDSSSPLSTYEPLASNPHTRFEVALRTAGEAGNIIAAVRGELRKLEPGLLIDKTQTMSERIDASVAPRRLNLLLFELFAGMALLLATIGLYGVVAYAVGQRSKEFGIRIALGAQGRDVLRLVLGEGLQLVLIGTALGMIVTLYAARLMTSLLFGVQPTDPPTLFAVAVLLATVAFLACWLPAYRVTRIAPLEALRNE